MMSPERSKTDRPASPNNADIAVPSVMIGQGDEDVLLLLLPLRTVTEEGRWHKLSLYIGRNLQTMLRKKTRRRNSTATVEAPVKPLSRENVRLDNTLQYAYLTTWHHIERQSHLHRMRVNEPLEHHEIYCDRRLAKHGCQSESTLEGQPHLRDRLSRWC